MKKKRRISFSTVYLALGLVIIYLPIALVILYSFNESKISSVWGGFSLKWYRTLFADKAMFQALGNSLILGLSASLAEAARDLGAGERQVFFTITLPLLLPAIVSGMLLSFAMSLDDVIISLFVTGVNVNTLPIKVYTALKTGVTPEINALCTLLLAATLLLVGLSMLWSKISRLTGSGR